VKRTLKNLPEEETTQRFNEARRAALRSLKIILAHSELEKQLIFC
jgi:hypothetical protein